MMRTVSSSAARAATLLGAATLLLSACGSTAPAALGDQQAAAVQPTQATKVGGGDSPTVTITPADHANGVRLDANLQVVTQGGTLTAVTFLEGDKPAPMEGSYSKGHDAFLVSGGLAADTTYSLRATSTSADGKATTASASFHTLAGDRLESSATPGDGATVGVGMPIKIHFNVSIPDDKKQSIIDHIAVNSAPVQNGGWYWPFNNEAHYRPQNYWLSGSSVTIDARLQGVDAGDGTWGMGNWTSTFKVGEKHVSIIDTASHVMRVFVNDAQVYSWPVSTGRPSLPTLGGTLVVLGKQQDILMDSRGLNIPINSQDGYHEHVYWDTAISANGFYVHSAPWSVWAQGSQNVSHGCVNLSPSRAVTFYDMSITGDVVQVINSPRVADNEDGEGDWQTRWEFFVPGGRAVVGGHAASPAAPLRVN